MGHCVGLAPAYAEAVRAGKKVIWSVRDPAGMPVFTLDVEVVSWREEGHTLTRYEVVQWKGDHDRAPGLSRGATGRFWQQVPADLRNALQSAAHDPVRQGELDLVLSVVRALRERFTLEARTADLRVLWAVRPGALDTP